MKTCEHCHDNPAYDLHIEHDNDKNVILYEGCNPCWKRLTDNPITRAAVEEALMNAEFARKDEQNELLVDNIKLRLDEIQLKKEITELSNAAHESSESLARETGRANYFEEEAKQLARREIDIKIQKVEPGSQYALLVSGGRITTSTLKVLEEFFSETSSKIAVVEAEDASSSRAKVELAKMTPNSRSFQTMPPGSMDEMRVFLTTLREKLNDGHYLAAGVITDRLIELCGKPEE